MLSLSPDRFLVLGHRGASASAAENTVEAFRLAHRQGADGVELDVRGTADGQLVVHHDAVIPGLGAITDLTTAELADAAPTLCSFAEAMEVCAGMIVNVEIKSSPADPDYDPEQMVAGLVVEWLHEHDRTDDVIVSSFDPATVDRVRYLSDRLATGQLIDAGADAARSLLAAHARGHQALHPHLTSLGPAANLASVARGLGMWVVTWTVNDPAAVRALKDAGLTGVITDDPASAVEAVS